MEKVKAFQPVDTFSWAVNRAERTHQVRLLVPFLDRPEGRAWLLERLKCPCTREEGQAAEVFHLCFPLRDIFSEDYYRCRGTPHLEDQFIAYYNELFGLPQDFGVKEVWRTAPGGEIRHPGAGARAGWYEDFLKERLSDKKLLAQARDMRQMLGTEADLFIQTTRHVVIVECKYRSRFSMEQYERQKRTGQTLARRLRKAFHFGMVCEDERDPGFAKIDEPYITWAEIAAKLGAI